MGGQVGVQKGEHGDAVAFQHPSHFGEVVKADILRQMREHRERRAHCRGARGAGNFGSGDQVKSPVRTLRRLPCEFEEFWNHVYSDISKPQAISQANRQSASPRSRCRRSARRLASLPRQGDRAQARQSRRTRRRPPPRKLAPATASTAAGRRRRDDNRSRIVQKATFNLPRASPSACMPCAFSLFGLSARSIRL